MNLKITVLLMLSPFLAIAQSLYGDFEGIVLETTDSPLPYVNVGVINRPIGTVSDTAGCFTLNLDNVSIRDTVRFSLVGYTPLKIPVSDFLNEKRNKLFYLEKHEIALAEVEVIVKERTQTEVGRKAKGGLLQATFNPSKTRLKEKVGTEIGMKMTYSGKSTALIKDFNWYFSSNNFDYLKFRVNVYTVDNGFPGTLITDQNIFVEVSAAKTGWINIDLQPYNIVVNGDFIISLQWLDNKISDSNVPRVWIPGTPSLFNDIYHKNGSQDKWRKSNAKISYYATLLN